MKTYITFSLFLFSILFTSCTDVIDVDVSTAIPRLVIEASIDWEKGTQGNNQFIKLSTSNAYYDNNTVTDVTNALVKITNNTTGEVFNFEDQDNGLYTINTFNPILHNFYTLEVQYEGETYLANEQLIPVVDISAIYQSTEDGFDDEALEVYIDFTDPAGVDNYYFIKIQAEDNLLPVMFDITDEFTDGNLMSLYYEREEDSDINQEEFKAGDVVAISFHGVSETYSNYIQLLIEQYESVGDPFTSTPVVLRGNCTNPTHPENFAYGYFRLTEVVKSTYTFE
ncbi:MAG: DUF4249 domain-containing protein [Flavobacteriaceae bacterium]|nr:DUF4249 domain-containing protein [Flavobacteriaceae bacterium]